MQVIASSAPATTVTIIQATGNINNGGGGGGGGNNPSNVLRTIGNTFNISNNQLNTIHSVATGQVFG